MKTAPYEIGSILRNSETGEIIKLTKYGRQIAYSIHRSISDNWVKTIPNYNYLYGINIESGQSIEGLTKNFELVEEN